MHVQATAQRLQLNDQEERQPLPNPPLLFGTLSQINRGPSPLRLLWTL